MRGSSFRSWVMFEAVPVHESMHELPPWLPYAPDDKQGHDNAAVRKREDTAELHRKKKSEAIESCFRDRHTSWI